MVSAFNINVEISCCHITVTRVCANLEAPHVAYGSSISYKNYTEKEYSQTNQHYDHLVLVLYCALLAMAQTIKERKNLETVMKADPELAEILNQLSELDQEDLVQVRKPHSQPSGKILELKSKQQLRDRPLISLLILSEFKRID